MWREPQRRHAVLANSENPTNSEDPRSGNAVSSRGPLSDAVVVSLPSDVALHARPAATFVKTAMKFRARLTVEANGKTADCKSILAVLAIGAIGGTTLTLRADGDDAPAALDALAASVTSLTE
jgi:phosphotransferase system HPr (HPr) family protein